MISIPRDLCYRDMKINYISLKYGMGRLLNGISWITGMRVKRYLAIDMFAFIKVIDILGGIDVTLESDLVDPTYKTKDFGRWSYLSYRKGTHHLNGVQALRVVRSRNYTSDFNRAQRQQRVVKALNDKLKSLSIVDMKRVYHLLQTLLQYVDTNLSPLELLAIFSRLKNYRVDFQNILDKTNVLRSSYYYVWLRNRHGYSSGALPEETRTGTSPSGMTDTSIRENSKLGPYILIPRNDDWNLIRWYIRVRLLATP